MKLQQRSKKTVAWGQVDAMCLSLFITSGQSAVIREEEADADRIFETIEEILGGDSR